MYVPLQVPCSSSCSDTTSLFIAQYMDYIIFPYSNPSGCCASVFKASPFWDSEVGSVYGAAQHAWTFATANVPTGSGATPAQCKHLRCVSVKSFASHLKKHTHLELESEPRSLLSHIRKAGEHIQLAVGQEQITVALIAMFDKGLSIRMNGLPAVVP